KGPIGTARSDAFNALGDIEKRVMRALKARNEVALEQVAKARANLFPNGKPQERVLNALQYLVRYGDPFVAQARAAIRYELDASFPAWRGVECG
ncbi:MAG TPA: bacillithiol biosynthesis BshC, partial [Longimicrobiales bacterium]